MVRGRRFLEVLVLAALVLTTLTAGIMGAAAANGGDDRGTTESLLKEIDSSPKKAVAGELVARSRASLERGARMRSAGDEAHAKLADSLARTWAEAARDVTRAAVVEESAAVARRGATDAGVLADRERALLEEAIAQSGRLRAQMESGKTGDDPVRTSTTANSDAGARVTPKPAIAKDGGAAPAPLTTVKDGGA